MTLDTITLRTAEIAVSEIDKTVLNNNKKLEINITQKVPFLIIPDSVISDNTVVSTTTVAPVDLSTITNTLTDTEYTTEKGSERYTYITTATSPLTNSKVRLYFDALFEDIIIIPNTIFFGTDLPDDPMNNKTLKVCGTSVGVGEFSGVERSTMKITMTKETTKITQGTKSNIDNTMYVLNLLGVSNGKSPGNHGEMHGDHYFEKDPFKPLGVIDLGTIDKLLDVTNGVPLLPANYIYQISGDTYEHSSCGNIKLPNIRIAFSF